MKTRTPILSRCLAMFLAVMLAFANVPGLMVTAFAAENAVSAGSVVADNYELSEAEKALLESGYLSADYTVEYDSAKDSWVTVDHENKKIVAASNDGWIATDAHIIVDGASVEDVALTDGEGTYTYDENAFSVEVHYELHKVVKNQAEMLAAIAALKQGVANTEAVAAQDGNLYILEQAMPELVDLAKNGVSTPLGPLTFNDELKAAVNALDAQMTANEGKLNLSVMVEAYDAASETAYIVSNGKDMKAEVVALYDNLSVINATLQDMANKISGFVAGGWVDAEVADQLKILAGVCNNIITGLDAVSKDEWYAANNTVVNAAGAELDELVLALGELTAVEVKDQLLVDTAVIKVNMAMSDVTVKVVLNVVEDKADSKLLVEAGSVTEVITLSDGATKAEIEAEAQTVINAALEGWAEVYSEANFAPEYSELPETLTEDVEYVVTYSPVDYVIDLGWTDDMTVPYGYKYTLPKHYNAEQAYDYYVDGELYAQGQVVVILGNTVITREAGKSYNAGDLYTIVANNFGDDVAKAILTSGALFDDIAVNYRKPDPADAASLLTLVDGILTANDYASDYEGIDWIPYTYGETGTENNFSGNTAEWDGKSVKVQYILALDNFGQAKAQEILDLAEALKAEAEGQKSAMDSLLGMKDTLAQLDKTKLGALNGVIDVTDFTEGDGTDTDAENLALRAELKAIVSAIIANNLDGNQLRILTMVTNYENNGLVYYYRNYSEIKKEIDSLVEYMGNLMDKEEALRIMCTAAGYGEYADKISDVEGKLKEYNEMLSAPNAKIDVDSANLGKLVAALNMEGTAECEASGSPYVLSEMLTAMDESQVNVQVIISTPAGNATVTTDTMDRGAVLEQSVIDALKANVEAEVEKLLGANEKYYDLEVSEELDALVGSELDGQVNVYYTYSYKEYTVVIEGEDDQIVTIGDLEIDLPKHPETGWTYKYTIDGVADIVSDSYTFTTEQLDRLFVEGVYTVARVAANDAEDNIADSTLEKWLVKENGKTVGVCARVDGNKNGVMGFAMDMVNSGYSYIALNGEAFLYLGEDSSLEICVQTLINAVLNDNSFGDHTLIGLGKNGKGEFVHAKMDLGNDADDLAFEGLDFTLYLETVPSQMATVANGLEKVQSYMSFNSNNGVMDVEVTLPEKVYEVYLAALLATDNVDKYTMNELNSEVAFQFLWDYVEIVKNSDADTETFTNTLAKLGIEKDLTGAEDYYQLMKRALNNEGLVVNPEDDNENVDISVTAKSQKAINGLINLLGIDVSAYELYLNMVKEYKYDDAVVYGAVSAKLGNTDKDFEAALLDVRHPVESKVDYLKKFDFTDNLPARAASIAGEAAIILLDDVDGNLVFNDATIIDLNGHTINGNITANGKTLIFDSSLDTFNCGGVNGELSGNLTIVGGNYTADVTAYIPSGYEVEDGTVRNILYTISNGEAQAQNFMTYARSANGEKVIFNVDTDIFDKDVASYTEAATMVAADVAVDLVLNYFTSASLTADGYNIYNITVTDIIGLYDSTNRKEALINTALSWVDLNDLNGFINGIIDKMIDFAAIEEAVRADEEFISFDAAVAPWSVTVDHIATGDYLTVGIAPNADKERTFTVGLRIEGSKKDYAANLAGGLSDMVVADETDAEVLINRPSYSNKHLTVSGEGSLVVVLDVTKDQNSANAMTFTNDEYLEVLAVALSYGLNDNKYVAAIGDDEALKDLIDNLTAAELITALKVMNVPNRFDAMCEKVGYTSTSNADKLENVYHLIAVALGEALEKLEINGPAKKLGNLYNETTGYYEISGTRAASKDLSAKGYTLTIGAEVTELTLRVKLFDDKQPVHVHTTATRIEDRVEPDCVNEGSYKLVTYCTECGTVLSVETVIIPALGHTPADPVTENVVAADCENEGSYDTVVYCEVCGCELSRVTTVVPALGHDWKLVERVEPTCTEAGYEIYECANGCGESFRVELEKLDHSWVLVDKTEPDCVNPGTETYQCEHCGETFTVETEDALGHDWGEWNVVVPATYEREGVMRRYCRICGEHQDRLIPKLRDPSDREDDENPSTGAPFVSALAAIAVLAGAAYASSKSRKN
ncbi:MAG: hypothetical protein IJA17_09860 [Oscillospiraceae bacterium]|nr:hypothetical protein [Oscillospiraceae bacterium]